MEAAEAAGTAAAELPAFEAFQILVGEPTRFEPACAPCFAQAYATEHRAAAVSVKRSLMCVACVSMLFVNRTQVLVRATSIVVR